MKTEAARARDVVAAAPGMIAGIIFIPGSLLVAWNMSWRLAETSEGVAWWIVFASVLAFLSPICMMAGGIAMMLVTVPCGYIIAALLPEKHINKTDAEHFDYKDLLPDSNAPSGRGDREARQGVELASTPQGYDPQA